MQATERMIHKVSVAEEAVFDYEELVGAQPPSAISSRRSKPI